MIKCVIWDLDHTLLAGVYLESPGHPPPADPQLAAALAELTSRGIIHAAASRNPPEAARHAAAVAGVTFAAERCGWERKPDSIRQILAELGVAADAAAYVDDDPFDRAEVSFALPDLMVLAPEDIADAMSWPEFSPAVITDEARRRGELYAQRRSRLRRSREFAGSAADFLAYCDTRVVIAPARAADLPRLHELSVRTHQYNSAGESRTPEQLAAALASPAHRLVTVALSDRFGDDGLVGGCVVETARPAEWRVPLLIMSCRAMGRGVIEALLAWLCRSAAGAGAAALAVPCVVSERNVPMRLALAAAGLRAAGPAYPDGRPAGGPALTVYTRALTEPPPAFPPGVTVCPGTP